VLNPRRWPHARDHRRLERPRRSLGSLHAGCSLTGLERRRSLLYSGWVPWCRSSTPGIVTAPVSGGASAASAAAAACSKRQEGATSMAVARARREARRSARVSARPVSAAAISLVLLAGGRGRVEGCRQRELLGSGARRSRGPALLERAGVAVTACRCCCCCQALPSLSLDRPPSQRTSSSHAPIPLSTLVAFSPVLSQTFAGPSPSLTSPASPCPRPPHDPPFPQQPLFSSPALSACSSAALIVRSVDPSRQPHTQSLPLFFDLALCGTASQHGRRAVRPPFALRAAVELVGQPPD
jgi:hypothetical protein